MAIPWDYVFIVLLILPILTPPMLAPAIVLDPLGLTLISGGLICWGMLIVLSVKTSAFEWLAASMGKRHIIINPKENKYLEFIPTKLTGSLSYLKDRGYYLTDPNDTFIEAKSKVPVTISYGNFAIPMDSKMVMAAAQLRAMGIKNYVHLIEFYKRFQGLAQEQIDALVLKRDELNGLIQTDPKHAKKYTKDIQEITALLEQNAKRSSPAITLWGESIPLSHIIDYFGKDERSDVIEAEIQRRTAAQTISKLMGHENIFKWAVILMIVLIGAAVAYVMITSGGGGGGGGIALPSLPTGTSLG